MYIVYVFKTYNNALFFSQIFYITLIFDEKEVRGRNLITQLDAKKQLFINAVTQASKDIGLDRSPQIIFCDVYIPNHPTNTRACIDTTSRTIYVSCKYLIDMGYEEIRHTAIHEITHIFNPSHDGNFHRKCQDTRSASWKPESTSGLVMIDGGGRTCLEQINKENEEPTIDISRCNYHLCESHDTNLLKCEHCGGYFCLEHIEPYPPMMPKFRVPKKFIKWKESKNAHPCPDYYDYLVEKEKDFHIRYSRSLDRMNYSTFSNYESKDISFFNTNEKSFDSISKQIDKIIDKFNNK